MSSIPDTLSELMHGGVPDATVEVWVRTVLAGLPNNEDPSSLEALNKLVNWMSKFTPRIVRRLAAHFHVPRSVVEEMSRDLRHIIREFLTFSASEHSAACPGVTAYIRYADETRAKGALSRSFYEWCFFGTRTRLFSFLKQTARSYGAPAELFKARESGQRARRRLVQAGHLVEYLRLGRQPDGTETWCHRHLHPEGQRPSNAVRSTERRFLTWSHARRYSEFLLLPEHIEREERLVAQLGKPGGIFQVRYLGKDSNPALLFWVFEHLHEPFPLLSTTLDAIFTASTRFHVANSEAVQQEALGRGNVGWVPAEDQEYDNHD